jgi:hypothetical protein
MRAVIVLFLVLLTGCATAPHDPRDPAIIRRAPAKLLPLP